MISHDTKARIAKLREEYQSPEDQAYIDDIEKKLRKAIKETELVDNPAIRKVIADTIQRIVDIGVLLAYDEKADRARLTGERDAHEFWLSRLGARDAKQTMDRLEKYLAEKA